MRYLFILTLVFLLCSCAKSPYPTSHRFLFQSKAQATQHWQKLAINFVDQMQERMSSSSQDCESFYVAESDHSSFGQAYRTFLILELTNRKSSEGKQIKVLPKNQANYVIDWSYQKVCHSAENSSIPGIPIGAGMVITDLLLGNRYDQMPHTEIILTSIAHNNKDELIRDTNIFYIDDRDTVNYGQQTIRSNFPPSTLLNKTFSVSSK